MKKDTKKILEDYDNNVELFKSFLTKSKSLIIDFLEDEKIIIHQITNRIKDKKSLENKIFKKGFKYKNISEITDISGLRIISYFEDDVDKIATIIENEFKIDVDNSIDKRTLEADKFGYRSLHYVVSLKDERLKLSEYKKFKNLKIEIQIRTILQHSWAEIEHDIGYKGELSIPDFAKRDFYRIAALLETADIEFVKLRDLIKNYENSVHLKITTNPEVVNLNKASLMSYINQNEIIKEYDNKFSECFNLPILDNDLESEVNSLLTRLKAVNINTIKELDDFVRNNKEELFEIYKNDFLIQEEEGDIFGLSKGMLIYQIDFLVNK